MKAKSVKTVTKREWQAFVDAIASVGNQCDRLRATARGQGSRTVPGAEVLEMHDRFEKAVTAFLGEKRRFWESREAFLNRITSLSPQGLLETMHRNGIQIKAE